MPAYERRIARGIYWTPSGWRLFVRIAGRLKPKRLHDPQHALGLVELKQRRTDWQTDARRELRAPAKQKPGGFADDARNKYLPTRKTMPTYTERERHIDIWIAEFGDRPRDSIQPWEIAKIRDRWLTEGPRLVCVKLTADEKRANPKSRSGKWVEVRAPLSASQVNKRLRALENVWTVLDGRHAPNPVREAGEAREDEPEARGLPYHVIEAILSLMPDRGRPEDGIRPPVSLSKLRCRVIAYAGLSHGELAGIETTDLHLDDVPPWVYVKGRQKGKGTTGASQPLSSLGAAALRALVQADGLGAFHAESLNRAFKRAASKVGLTGVRAYDLRHSFASEVLEKLEGNVGATQLVMRQKDQRTTLRYAKRAIDPVRLAAVQAIEARGGFAGTTKPSE